MADKKKESTLDSFAKALGRKLGKRRKEVHQSIERFHEEANKADESTTPPTETSTADEASSRPASDQN